MNVSSTTNACSTWSILLLHMWSIRVLEVGVIRVLQLVFAGRNKCSIIVLSSDVDASSVCLRSMFRSPIMIAVYFYDSGIFLMLLRSSFSFSMNKAVFEFGHAFGQ